MLQPALQALLEGIVDYAGLFPPAALDLDSTVRNFLEYRASGQAWMLGRVVIPAGKLGQLPPLAVAGTDQDAEISVLLPAIEADEPLFREAVGLLAAFVNAPAQGWSVRAVESRAESASGLSAAAAMLPEGIEVFWELPHESDGLSSLIAAVAALGSEENLGRRHCAKIRTGGVLPAQIPPVGQVARFLVNCAEMGVAFKATAGLHHPVRAVQNLTYAADSPRAVMHGFLNVFCAAGLAWSGRRDAVLIENVLAETDADQFRPGEGGIVFGRHRLSLAEIRAMRTRFARSFGSCSFCEPVDDLLKMGWPLAGQVAPACDP